MADKYIKDLTETTTDLATGDMFVVEKADSSGTKISRLSNLWNSIYNKFVKNNLTTSESGYVLDARQGKVLADTSLIQGQSWIANADIDTFTKIGSYMIGGTPTNGPISTTGNQEDWYVLVVVGISSATYRQIALTRRQYIAVRDYSSGAFQQWIKYPSSASMTTQVVAPTVTIANGYGQATTSCAKTGLKAIGVAGWSLGSSWYTCTIAYVNVPNQTITVEIRNIANASASGTATPNIYVLYIPG